MSSEVKATLIFLVLGIELSILVTLILFFISLFLKIKELRKIKKFHN